MWARAERIRGNFQNNGRGPLPFFLFDIETQVVTNRGAFRCRRVVVAGGAWANSVLASVGVKLPLTVTQEQVLYLATPNIKEFTKSR